MDKEFPTWKEIILEIDSTLAEVPYKSNAIYGARIAYDMLYDIFNDSKKTSQETGRIDKSNLI